MTPPVHIQTLVKRGALFAVSHSGGKDSQAMLIALRRMGIPEQQMVLFYADLGNVVWSGTVEHIERYSRGLLLIKAKAVKTFFEMVRTRGMFPSPKYRQCTSDLKRGPIEREIRRYLKRTPMQSPIVVNCMGLRAQESTDRAKRTTFKYIPRNSKAGREWYDWLPIHQLSEADVFETILTAQERPHPAYAAGMSRLSCCFCIMSSLADLQTAARLQPELYARYAALEREVEHTMSMTGTPIEQVTGIKASFINQTKGNQNVSI